MDTGNKIISGRPDSNFPRAWTIIICLALMMSLSGCTSKPKEPGSMSGGRVEWSAMDISQRKQHMEQVVLPIAAAVFQSWRPERYVDVNCSLCHGRGFQIDDFQMPSDHLPRLSGDLFLGSEFRNHPETTRLKLQRLVPEMAAALGKKEFSLITRKGFGCYSCHLGPTGPMFGN